MGMMTRRNVKHRAVKKTAHAKPFVEIKEEVTEEKAVYTKTEINRMPITDLKELASKKGIENAEELTGAELKKILIEKFEL